MPTRTVVASGLWNDPATWEGGNIPQDGDDVNHPSPYVVILNVNSPAIQNYALNGTLLIRANEPRILRVVSFSGNGGIDIEETTQDSLPPILIQGTGASPLNMTSFTFFTFYRSHFMRTVHRNWWKDKAVYVGDQIVSPLFPRVVSVQRVGGDVEMTVETVSGSPALHYLLAHVGQSVPFLLPFNHPTFTSFAMLLSAPVNLRVASTTLLVYENAPAGVEDKIVVGAHVVIYTHTSLCPLVFDNVLLPVLSHIGEIFTPTCVLDTVDQHRAMFIFCILQGVLSAPLLHGDEIIYVGAENTQGVLDVNGLLWCAYTED